MLSVGCCWCRCCCHCGDGCCCSRYCRLCVALCVALQNDFHNLDQMTPFNKFRVTVVVNMWGEPSLDKIQEASVS